MDHGGLPKFAVHHLSLSLFLSLWHSQSLKERGLRDLGKEGSRMEPAEGGGELARVTAG